MRSVIRALVIGLVALGACVGDEPVVSGPSDSSDAGIEAAAGDGSDAQGGGGPTHAAEAVSFVDVDPKVGTVGGTIRITKAANESDITSYAIYTGDKNGTKTSPTALGTLTAANKNLTYHLAEGTMPQPNVTSLLVFTQNATGEMATGVSTPLKDATPHYVPISVPDAGSIGGTSQVLFDEANRKLLIVTGHPYLFRCDLDGTGCVQSDLSAGHTANYLSISANIDSASNKLLIVASEPTNAVPVLFRSNLDGSSPSYFDISASQPTNSAVAVGAFLDAKNSKLLIAADDYSVTTSFPALYTCNTDGSDATFQNVSTGTTEPTTGLAGASPSVVLDDVGGNYLMVTADVSNHFNPSLWICPTVGGACTRNDVVSDTSTGRAALGAQIFLDTSATKIDIVTATDDDTPLLFRCNLDGSNCSTIDLTAGTTADAMPAQGASAVLDTLDGKLGVFTEDRGNGFKPALFRCNIDGTSCTYTDVSAAATFSVGTLSIAVDPESGQLFGLAVDADANDQPSLFYLQ